MTLQNGQRKVKTICLVLISSSWLSVETMIEGQVKRFNELWCPQNIPRPIVSNARMDAWMVGITKSLPATPGTNSKMVALQTFFFIT